MAAKKAKKPLPVATPAQVADAPVGLPVNAIDRHHEEYDAIRPFYSAIGPLYRGGYELQQNASKFLRKRPVEPPAVYTARTEAFTYQNILQSGIGWYVSGLYADPPEIFLSEKETRIDDQFLEDFLRNADRCGNSLLDISKKWLIGAALNGAAYVLIDLPASDIASSFRQQKQRGDLNAYLVTFDANQVINWATDQAGNFEWVVIATQRVERQFGRAPVIWDQWYYFDRAEYRLYEAERPDGSSKQANDRMAAVVAWGRHALADQARVPVRKIEVPDHLWLAYRVYLQVLNHLNQDNSLSWALEQSNLAVPVIIGEYEDKPVVSETAFIHLPNSGSRFEWTEPPGRSFQHSANRVDSLREEIYRQMHLQAQGRSSSATPAAQSGYSKEQDMAPSRDVANAFGGLIRAAIKAVVEDAALIASREVTAEISGLEAEDDGAIIDIAEAQAALDLQIPSPKFDTFVYARIASRVTRRAPPETRSEIQQEIEAAPSRADRQAAAQGAITNQFSNSLETALAKDALKQ